MRAVATLQHLELTRHLERRWQVIPHQVCLRRHKPKSTSRSDTFAFMTLDIEHTTRILISRITVLGKLTWKFRTLQQKIHRLSSMIAKALNLETRVIGRQLRSFLFLGTRMESLRTGSTRSGNVIIISNLVQYLICPRLCIETPRTGARTDHIGNENLLILAQKRNPTSSFHILANSH